MCLHVLLAHAPQRRRDRVVHDESWWTIDKLRPLFLVICAMVFKDPDPL
jgi:hypothetical protein